MNNNQGSPHVKPQMEKSIALSDINLRDYKFYLIKSNAISIKEDVSVNIKDYIHPKTRILIEKALKDFFTQKSKGTPHSRSVNLRNTVSSIKLLAPALGKSVSNKSVQTSKLTVCLHYKFDTNKSVENNFNKYKEVKSFKKIFNIYNQDVSCPGNIPQLTSTVKRIAPSDIEETRKRLHITRVSSSAPTLLVNKGIAAVNSSSSSNNHQSKTEMRYINIKCNTKLQHIPITQTLHKNNSQLLQSKASSTYLFNRNSNNYNFISKTHSSLSHAQELKTYSRKNDSSSSGLSSVTAEHKYLIHRTADRFHKIQQNNITSGIQKIYNHRNKLHSEVKSISTSVISTAPAYGNSEHVKLTNYNNCCKDCVLNGGQESNILFSRDNDNCSSCVDYNLLLQNLNRK